MAWKSERVGWMHDLAAGLPGGVLHAWYRTRTRGLEHLSGIRGRPAVLYCHPHTHNPYDLLLESNLVLRAGLRGHYIMKDSLPSWFTLLGGLPIMRKKDLLVKLQETPKEKRRDLITYARDLSERLFGEIIPRIFAADGLVVIQAGGGIGDTRFHPDLAEKVYNSGCLSSIQGRKVSHVTMRIEKDGSSFRNAVFRIREPFSVRTAGELHERVTYELRMNETL